MEFIIVHEFLYLFCTHPLLKCSQLATYSFSHMSDSSEVSSLLEHYGLTEEECNKVVSDRHLDKISLSHCGGWRALPSHLGLPSILVEDIDKSPLEQKEKRQKFFRDWKQRRGFNATYRSLIIALLETNHRGDAESVCQLLKDSAPPQTKQPKATVSAPRSIPTLPSAPLYAGKLS